MKTKVLNWPEVWVSSSGLLQNLHLVAVEALRVWGSSIIVLALSDGVSVHAGRSSSSSVTHSEKKKLDKISNNSDHHLRSWTRMIFTRTSIYALVPDYPPPFVYVGSPVNPATFTHICSR